MNQQIVRKKINRKKLERKGYQVPKAVMMLLEAMGKVKTLVPKAACYTRHQGPRECARRVRQMQKTTSS